MMDDWIKELLYIYSMGYYIAIKKDEIQPSLTTCMQPEVMKQSKISQKVKEDGFFHMWNTNNQRKQITHTKVTFF